MSATTTTVKRNIKSISSEKEVDNAANNDQKSSKYWYIQGKAYDLEPFLSTHPGGRTILEMCRGSDCTALFLSVHATPPSEQERKRFLVDTEGVSAENNISASPINQVQPYVHDENDYLTFKRKIYEEIKRRGLTTHATSGELQLTAIAMLIYFALYYFMMSTGSYLVAFAFGIVRALVSLCVGHPGSHFSLMRGEQNVRFFKFFSPWVLSDLSVWVPSHCVSHHVETFVDSDLQDNYPLKRLHPTLKAFFFHKWQHLYVWLVYAVALPLWTIQDFFETFAMLVTRTPLKRYYDSGYLPKLQTMAGLLWNLLFIYYFPFQEYGFRLVLAHTIPSSLWVVLSIMVNHEVDIHDHDHTKTADWAAFQILHSHNFGADSWWTCVLTGGLNLQVEHHLFPSIYFTRLFEVRHIVKEYCQKRGLPYNESPNILVACQKHFRLLRQMGQVA